MYGVLDLEWTKHQEIIEVCCFIPEANETLHLYSKPKYSIMKGSYVSKITNISDDMLTNCLDETEVLKQLHNFLQHNHCDTIYCWGMEDCRVLRRKQNKYFSQYTFKDIQKSYMDIANSTSLPSLSDAIIEVGEVFEGEKHSALYDTLNTTKVLNKISAFA